jgi:hypothetical protein
MELPAGILSPKEVARRGLLQELGGTAADLRYIEQFHTSSGISNEVAWIYLATSVDLGRANREPTERSAELTPRADGDPPRAG